jgi:transcriptional regulator with XRE-family HTH domain
LNINSSLVVELKDKGYRDAYVASQIRIGLPLQVRALRKSRGWTQPELAEYANMAQPRISEIEKPGERKLNIDTLLRLAAAFDVGLQVRFVPFSELINSSESLDLDTLWIPSFDAELNAPIATSGLNFTLSSSGQLHDLWHGPQSNYVGFNLNMLDGTMWRVVHPPEDYKSMRYHFSNTPMEVKKQPESEASPYSLIPTRQMGAGGNLDG